MRVESGAEAFPSAHGVVMWSRREASQSAGSLVGAAAAATAASEAASRARHANMGSCRQGRRFVPPMLQACWKVVIITEDFEEIRGSTH